MTPEEEKILSQAITEAAEKSIQLQKEKIYREGKKEGKKENNKEIAKKLKNILTPEEIHKITGLTITTILKL